MTKIEINFFLCFALNDKQESIVEIRRPKWMSDPTPHRDNQLNSAPLRDVRNTNSTPKTFSISLPLNP